MIEKNSSQNIIEITQITTPKEIMKKFFSFSLILLCILLLSAFFIATIRGKNQKVHITPHIVPIATGAIDEVPVEEKKAIKPKSKIEELKKRYALRWLIYEWNGYFENEQYALALKKYLEVYSQTSDKNTAEKIADTYFAMKKYSLAHKYYSLIGTSKTNERTFFSLLYHTNVENPDNMNYLLKEIDGLTFNGEKTFFYKNSLSCIKDFEACKKIFEEYIQKPAEPLVSEELKTTKQTLDNYANFKIDDPLYKDALIISNFYTLALYPIVIKLWKDLLLKKPDYKPMLLMVAQSLYEVWDYENAKGFLEKYNALSPNDKNALYLLGVIHLKNNDFILSNIFLNKALDLWYEPKINLKRRLIYNYEILGQREKLLQEFEKLIREQKDFSLEDAYLALYYHIINKKEDIALELWKLVLQKYENDGNIYAYLGWIYRSKKDFQKSQENLKKALILAPESAFVNLQESLLLVDMDKKQEAIVSLKKTIKIWHNDEFAKQAESALFQLENN